jgi:hypothetical protein
MAAIPFEKSDLGLSWHLQLVLLQTRQSIIAFSACHPGLDPNGESRPIILDCWFQPSSRAVQIQASKHEKRD